MRTKECTNIHPLDGADFIVGPDEPILVTGATGFLGPAVVESLFRHGFRNIRAFARESSHTARLDAIAERNSAKGRIEVVRGNLLSREDCAKAVQNVAVILHLAMGADKSFPGAFLNTVVTTRNLLDATLEYTRLRRFVNISSFAVYNNTQKDLLDEYSPIEEQPGTAGDSYRFAKIKQDELVMEYGARFGIPYVIVRPGSVFGPGKESITSRVGIDTFGFFAHMGGSNRIPFTYVDNCADATVLAGVKPGIEGEIFNVVDDDLPSSRRFLREYKRHVRSFSSIYIPHLVSYVLCWGWERYSEWSQGQLPPAFNRRRWRAEWKATRYSNEKLKTRLGWTPKVSMAEGLHLYLEGCRNRLHA